MGKRMQDTNAMNVDEQSNGVVKPIIFFDGVCAMCDAFVSHVLRLDLDRNFLFAPLEGSTAHTLLPPLSENRYHWSMIYLDERGIHDQSDAALEVYSRLGGIWWLLGLARYVPRLIRNPVYRFVARHRYRWFGVREQCRIPSAEERQRFLP